ncbi:uncharacterized protein CLUP02_08473 [Colletotrichum lupini]|uniref:Uncharacterized protein n=1 Tax=Colletotrichum lupini TaxID=145971 RepID=A0A9Q8STM1_9PEZI|nr:uncharacterized protein CLUP02_08473 [Colletotrichum lupini]UQC82983.1 hypothetical protein CLUP02_08473 [Colletotrichum lupini]
MVRGTQSIFYSLCPTKTVKLCLCFTTYGLAFSIPYMHPPIAFHFPLLSSPFLPSLPPPSIIILSFPSVNCSTFIKFQGTTTLATKMQKC